MDNSINPKQRNFFVGLMILIGLAIIVFFGLRTARAFRQFHGQRPVPHLEDYPMETDVDLIRDWMTLPYISITYRLPPDLLYQALAIPPDKNERKSLRQLNNQYFPETPGFVLDTVKTTILARQATLTATSPPTGNP